MIPQLPPYLTEALTRQYGPEETQRIIEGYTERPVTLRINPLRTDHEAALHHLDEAGIRYEPVPWYADALILPEVREDAVRALPLYEQGAVYLQSLSSMLPALVLQAQPGETVLDMAAAPGGKTTQIAALTGGRALITACEKNPLRAERLRFNLERQGARRATVLQQDARDLNDLFSFDRILLDAPCTGSGTLLLREGEPQRRMEAGWVKKTAATQLAMLQKALRLLRKGHELVYSTCSIMEIENEQVVRQALKNGGAEVLPVDPALAEQLPLLPTSLPGCLCVRPTALFEGFFVARLRKK